MVIHRIWNQLGLKLWTWLAWLITFNFINIAWIFFRAKEWDDAIKLLSGMFGLNGINLPRSFYGKLNFLESWGIVFGSFISNVTNDRIILIYLPLFLILSIFFSILMNIKKYLKQILYFFYINYSIYSFDCKLI